jgi:hypothetical protein
LGNYSTNDFGFDQAIVNGVLTGLQNGLDGPNGVYQFSLTPVLPTSNYLSSNYYVDLVFNTSLATGSPAARLAVASPKAGQLPRLHREVKMEVYPNPITETTTVHFVLEEAGPYSLGLYNANGRLVKLLKKGQAKTGESNAIEVNGAKLARGLYLLRLQTSKGVKTAKLLR